jgi:C4-dicarboxylate transporter DctM subunit
MVSVLASMIFASISGSGAADAGAIGSLMIPPMLKKGYERGFCAAIVASGAVIGAIIPPSINMVLWCSITGLSVGALFLSGVVPGVLMGLFLMVCVYMYAKKNPKVDEGTYGVKISFKELLRLTKETSCAFLIPIVIIGGIVSGIFTATEAAAVSIFVALFCGIIVYRELPVSKLFKYLADTAVTVATVMIVLGYAMTLGWAMSVGNFTEGIIKWMTTLTDNPTVFLMIVILIFTALGTFMNAPACIMIFAPVLSPMAERYGFNPIHFAVICIMVIQIGAITPPEGGILYISLGIAQVGLGEAFRYFVPTIIALTLATVVSAVLPDFVLFLPKLFGLI